MRDMHLGGKKQKRHTILGVRYLGKERFGHSGSSVDRCGTDRDL